MWINDILFDIFYVFSLASRFTDHNKKYTAECFLSSNHVALFGEFIFSLRFFAYKHFCYFLSLSLLFTYNSLVEAHFLISRQW